MPNMDPRPEDVLAYMQQRPSDIFGRSYAVGVDFGNTVNTNRTYGIPNSYPVGINYEPAGPIGVIGPAGPPGEPSRSSTDGLRLGWNIYEEVGTVVINNDAVARLNIEPTAEERERAIADALNTPEGREALARSMVEPIRTRVEYNTKKRNRFRWFNQVFGEKPEAGAMSATAKKHKDWDSRWEDI
jgi:hypothetical protein